MVIKKKELASKPEMGKNFNFIVADVCNPVFVIQFYLCNTIETCDNPFNCE